MRRVVTLVSAMLLSPVIAHAQDCPTAETAKRGFAVERGALQKTEVFTGDDGTVRTSMRYRGETLLETTLFAGLFSLSRLDRGHRLTYTPLTNLKTLFPLKVGGKALALFDYSKDGKTMPMTVVLLVKSSEPLAIGPCTYTVLKLDRTEAFGERVAPRYVYTEYYSPDLKLVLMREYRDPGKSSTFVKFDKIYTTPRER
jgi:hypothetical protein